MNAALAAPIIFNVVVISTVSAAPSVSEFALVADDLVSQFLGCAGLLLAALSTGIRFPKRAQCQRILCLLCIPYIPLSPILAITTAALLALLRMVAFGLVRLAIIPLLHALIMVVPILRISALLVGLFDLLSALPAISTLVLHVLLLTDAYGLEPLVTTPQFHVTTLAVPTLQINAFPMLR